MTEFEIFQSHWNRLSTYALSQMLYKINTEKAWAEGAERGLSDANERAHATNMINKYREWRDYAQACVDARSWQE